MNKSLFKSIKSALNLSYLSIIVLFCLAISTSFMSINYMAKYMSTDGGFDGAKVAKFEVQVNKTDGNKTITLKEDVADGTYAFTVTSNSEVAVEYDVVITFPETIPSSINLKLDGNSPLTDGTTCTFEGAGTISANGGQNSHKLTVSTEDFGKAIDLTGITVKIVARQID